MRSNKNSSGIEIVKADMAGIYLGNRFTVDADLQLPERGKLGATITWSSKNKSVIRDDGRVRRPEPGEGNRVVTLVATVAFGEVSGTRDFEVTVVEKERPGVITQIREIESITFAGNSPELPRVVITTKDDGSFGVAEIVWDTPEQRLYAHTGQFVLEGTVKGTDIKAKANISVVEPEESCNSGPEPENVVSGQSRIKPPALPFSLGSVSLQKSIFTENRDRDYSYLLSRNAEQLLYCFRDAAGLDTKNAPPMEGWDAPDSKLRGHTTGHYLTALAHAYASSGDTVFREKIDYMVAELGKCQDAMEESGKFSPGFLSGYSEDQFNQLELLATYPSIWAPYYTLHKIMAGLLDCYQLAGNKQALNIADKLGDWVYAKLKRLDRDLLSRMWSLYIAGEYGGMNEVMASLAEITGKVEFLSAARLFDNEKLFVPLADRIDALGGMHANQHIPQVIGAMKIYDVTKEPYYYAISKSFWEMVVNHHTYNIGGNGSGEMFKPADKIAQYITDKTAETCATYNMLKLTRYLFMVDPQPGYMDYYERALYNHIVGSQDRSAPNGGSTYFMPLQPGAQKEYDSDGNSCCHGTGMENHTKYQDTIYFYSEDLTTLYVNLFIPSTLCWEEKGFKITQTGDYLKEQSISLLVEGSGHLAIKLRVPNWVEKTFTVKINGVEQEMTGIPGSYMTLNREWENGDRIDVSIPFSFRLEPSPDDPTVTAILYGPLVMAGICESEEYLELNLNGADLNQIIQQDSCPLTFQVGGITLVPHYSVQQERYHSYFRISNV